MALDARNVIPGQTTAGIKGPAADRVPSDFENLSRLTALPALPYV